jgi:perosamine synthetase
VLCGTRTAIATCNGTAALHLAVLALGLGEQDEVLVPALAYVATANAVVYARGVPVFVDVDPLTWCLDPVLLEAAITPRTRGIIAVHTYGHPADMDTINDVATRYGLWVIEDAAEAHLARYKGRPVGGLARIAAFSFYANKILTAGEGGALTMNDPELEARARLLRGQGMDVDRPYFFPVTGYNYRLSNVACALLCGQLERRETLVGRRRQLFEWYRAALSDVPGIAFQPAAGWAQPAPWLFCLTVAEERYGKSRDALMKRLGDRGIETRPFFIPLHELPPFRQKGLAPLPVSERLGREGINLPTHSGVGESDVKRIADTIRRYPRIV